MRNLLTRVPKSAQSFVATLVRSIFAQPDGASTRAQHARVVAELTKRFLAAAELLTDVAADLLAFADFPKEHWKKIWSNDPRGAPQPGDPPAHGRGRHLPQPGCRHPPGGIGPR